MFRVSIMPAHLFESLGKELIALANVSRTFLGKRTSQCVGQGWHIFLHWLILLFQLSFFIQLQLSWEIWYFSHLCWTRQFLCCVWTCDRASGLFVCSQVEKDMFQEVTVPVEPLSAPPSRVWIPPRLCRSSWLARLASLWPPPGRRETSAWSPDMQGYN